MALQHLSQHGQISGLPISTHLHGLELPAWCNSALLPLSSGTNVARLAGAGTSRPGSAIIIRGFDSQQLLGSRWNRGSHRSADSAIGAACVEPASSSAPAAHVSLEGTGMELRSFSNGHRVTGVALIHPTSTWPSHTVNLKYMFIVGVSQSCSLS